MTASFVQPGTRMRRWYALAQRHRRMAERLLRSGFVDGAIFHAYHAYECAVSAFLAAQGLPVPPSHSGRITRFHQLADSTKPYGAGHRQMTFFTALVRNDSLYYDETQDLLPTDQFNAAFAAQTLVLVHQFARAIWQEIR